jgi:hypothetical protein
VGEFARSCLPSFPAGHAAPRPRQTDLRQVVADLEGRLAPWVDGDGSLRVTTELVIGSARRRR